MPSFPKKRGTTISESPGATPCERSLTIPRRRRAGGAAVSVALAAAMLGAPSALAADKNAVTRIGGVDRIETALLTFTKNRALFGPDRAVLTRSDDYPDALTATPLAAALKAPLLSTGRDALDPRVLETLKSQGVTKVTIVGGLSALSEQVVQSLTSAGITVDRVAGKDRYETSLAVAQRIVSERKSQAPAAGLAAAETPLVAVVARGDHFADSLGAGAAAGRLGGVLVLSMNDRLPASINGFLHSGNLRTLAVGGSAATAVDEAGVKAEKIVGEDRADTSAKLAKALPAPKVVLIASGVNFADGLAAGVLAALQGGVVILSFPDTLTRSVAEYLSEVQVPVTIVGGPSAVSSDVAGQADTANDGTVPSLPKDPTKPGDTNPKPPTPPNDPPVPPTTPRPPGGGTGGSGTGTGSSGSQPNLIAVDELQIIGKGEYVQGRVSLQGKGADLTVKVVPTPTSFGVLYTSVGDSTLSVSPQRSANGLFELQLVDRRGRLLDTLRVVVRNARTPFLRGEATTLPTYEGAETWAEISRVPGTETVAVLLDGSGREVSGVELTSRTTEFDDSIRLRMGADAPAPGVYQLVLRSPDGATSYDTEKVTIYRQPTLASLEPITLEEGWQDSVEVPVNDPDGVGYFEGWFQRVDGQHNQWPKIGVSGERRGVITLKAGQWEPGDVRITFDPTLGAAIEAGTATPEQLSQALLVHVTPRKAANFAPSAGRGIAGEPFAVTIDPRTQQFSDLTVRIDSSGSAARGFSVGPIIDGKAVVTTPALPAGTNKADVRLELLHRGVVIDTTSLTVTPAPKFVRSAGETVPEITTTRMSRGFVDGLLLDHMSSSAKARVTIGEASPNARQVDGGLEDGIVRFWAPGVTGRVKIELVHPSDDSIVFDTGYVNVLAPPTFADASLALTAGGTTTAAVTGADAVNVPLAAVVVDRFGNIMLPEEGFTTQVSTVDGRPVVSVTASADAPTGDYTVYLREATYRGTDDPNTFGIEQDLTLATSSFAEVALKVSRP